MMRRELGGRYLVLALVASVGLGCYGPKFEDDCTIKCSNEIGCPGGLSCRGGYCTSGPQQCRMDGGPDTGGDGDAETDLGDAPMSDTDGSGDLSEAGDHDTDEPDGMDADADGPMGTDVGADPDGPLDTDVGPDPDGPTNTDVDADPDVPLDTPVEAGPDVPLDTPVEAGPDVPLDTPADSPDGPRPEAGQPDGIDGPDGGDRPPPWTPAVIPNLVLWLESDRGIDAVLGAKISAWRDQSGLHNDAKQDTEMFAPKLAADPLSGMPRVEFTPKAWMMIKDDLSLRWGVLDFLVLVVYRSTGPGRCLSPTCYLQQLYRKQEVDEPWVGPGLGLQPDGRIEVHLSHSAENHWLASPAPGYDSGRIHLAGAQRRSSWPSLRIDGIDYPSGRPTAAVNLDAPGQNVYFGAHGINPAPPIDFPFSGYISAIIAVADPISAADLAQLESYLMAKYGIAPGGPP
jgi:hypothetical protein